MSDACANQQCPIVGGATWPICVGPNGCMRSRNGPILAKPEVKVGYVCLEPDETMKELDEVMKGGIPADKIAKVYGPVQSVYARFGGKPRSKPKMGPIERNERNRNSRRSVSVSKALYGKLKASAEANNKSMSSIVEGECELFFRCDDDSLKDSES